ncbi:MAG: PQQ-binding-like beta-propeller repeat protein, partial [Gemmataceae bacterium]
CRDLNEDCEPITSINVGFGILAVRIGEHHIACLDAPTLQVKWITDASGRLGYWPYHQSATSRFGPKLLVTSSGIVCQRLDGQALVLEMTTGAVRYQVPTTMTPWKTPPHMFNQLCLIPGGPGQVTAFDPIDGEKHWQSEAPNESGLSGLSPAIRPVDDELFVGIDRNHGVELHYLDDKTGRSKWRRPVFLTTTTPPLVGLDGNGSTIFATTCDTVLAIRKIDGWVLWRKPLPHASESWNVSAAVGGVIVSPRSALERESFHSAYFQESFWNSPTLTRTIGHIAAIVENYFARTAPIVILDPSNGRELRRLELPIRGVGLDCRFHPTGGVVASAGTIYLLK